MILSNENGRARLLLDAGHAEYLPTFPTEEVWSPHDVEDYVDLPDEKFAELVREALPLAAVEAGWMPYDPTFCTVIAVTGAWGELADLFAALLGQLAVRPTGDDTTFDYWPSGARLALEMAADLDELLGGQHGHTADRVLRGVLDELGEVADEVREKTGLSETAGILYWGHSPLCTVTRARVDLLAKIAEAVDADEDPRSMQTLFGAAVEYFGGGDQEAEECSCEWRKRVQAAIDSALAQKDAPEGHRIVNPDWPSGDGPHIEKVDDDDRVPTFGDPDWNEAEEEERLNRQAEGEDR